MSQDSVLRTVQFMALYASLKLQLDEAFRQENFRLAVGLYLEACKKPVKRERYAEVNFPKFSNPHTCTLSDFIQSAFRGTRYCSLQRSFSFTYCPG